MIQIYKHKTRKLENPDLMIHSSSQEQDFQPVIQPNHAGTNHSHTLTSAMPPAGPHWPRLSPTERPLPAPPSSDWAPEVGERPSANATQTLIGTQTAASSLVDLLVDSPLEWRQLISEANFGPQADQQQVGVSKGSSKGSSKGAGLRLGQFLSEQQLKRQEVINELIRTERHHCLTLALMRQVYRAGLSRLNAGRSSSALAGGAGRRPEVAADGHQQAADAEQQHHQQQAGAVAAGPSAEPVDLERLFPALEELVQAHELFFAHLRLKLVQCCGGGQAVAAGSGSSYEAVSGQGQSSAEGRPEGKGARLLGIVGPVGELLLDQFRLASGRQLDERAAPAEVRRGRALAGSRAIKVDRRARSASVAASLELQTRLGGGALLAGGHSQRKQQKQEATNGAKLLAAYAKFCGQHFDSSKYFKRLMQHDKEFKQFIEVSFSPAFWQPFGSLFSPLESSFSANFRQIFREFLASFVQFWSGEFFSKKLFPNFLENFVKQATD